MDASPVSMMPSAARQCPACGQIAIVGHGRRRRQAHDGIHRWFWFAAAFARFAAER